MNITYSQEKIFDAKTLLDFFTVSGNPDAKYEETLVEAINNAGTVVSAWDKDSNELAALITVVDDGKMTAYIRYLVVATIYRVKGINVEFISLVKAKYEYYPYLFAFALYVFHASFFSKLGFKVLDGAKVLAR